MVDWLKALARMALGACGGPGVGAIGMCLTGNFAIALMADPAVLASVASQPALPFVAATPVIGTLMTAACASLALTPADQEAAQRRAAAGARDSSRAARSMPTSPEPLPKFSAIRLRR